MNPIVFTATVVVMAIACGAAIAMISIGRRRKAFESFAAANGFTYSHRRPELPEQSFFTLPFMIEGKAVGGVHNVVEGALDSTPFLAFEYMITRMKTTYQFSVATFRRDATDDFAMSVQPTALSFLPDLGLKEVPGLFRDSHRRVLVSDLGELQNAKRAFRDVFERAPTFCCDVNREWMVVYPVVVVKSFQVVAGSPTDVRVAPAKLRDFLNQAHTLFRATEDSG